MLRMCRCDNNFRHQWINIGKIFSRNNRRQTSVQFAWLMPTLWSSKRLDQSRKDYRLLFPLILPYSDCDLFQIKHFGRFHCMVPSQDKRGNLRSAYFRHGRIWFLNGPIMGGGGGGGGIKSTSLYSNYDKMIIVDDKMDKAGIVLSLSTRDRSVGPVTWYREHFNEIPWQDFIITTLPVSTYNGKKTSNIGIIP